MEHIEQPISDPQITSTLEMEEHASRIEAEKAAVSQVIQQINIMVEETTKRDEKLIRETKCLEKELKKEKMSLAGLAVLESIYVKESREELKHLEHLYNELNEKIHVMMHMERELEYKRGVNHATLHADPIFALIQEERRLTQQLEALGVRVHPPRHPNGQLE